MRPSDSPALVAATELAGRLLLAFLFLHEAWSKLSAFGAAGAYMVTAFPPCSCRSRWPSN
jgi:hypothetical protein